MDDFTPPPATSCVGPQTAGVERTDPLIGRYDSMLDRARDLLRDAAYKTRPAET